MMSSEINDQAMGSAREELQESRMRIESFGYQLSALQKQVLLCDTRLCVSAPCVIQLSELLIGFMNEWSCWSLACVSEGGCL